MKTVEDADCVEDVLCRSFSWVILQELVTLLLTSSISC